MKTKYYWKIVCKTDNPEVYKSYVIEKGKFCLTYEIGKITKSIIEESGILTFNTREQARKFRSEAKDRKSKIFKVIPTGKRIENPVLYYWSDLKNNNCRTKAIYGNFPDGTVAFDSVKVVGE